MKLLKNIWYVAAWSSEVKSGAPLGRKLLGENMVMFRDTAGSVHLLRDRCPHRFAPLSKGIVVDDAIQCPYHGLHFGKEGKCVHNPHGDKTIPRAAKVSSFQVVERYGAVWFWPGDPALVDPATIPDFSAMDPQDNFVGQGYLHVRANYQLETDNIMDLSHIEYLHPTSLGNGIVNGGTTEVTQEGRTIWSKRMTSAERLPMAMEQHYNLPAEKLWDRWLDVRWDPPSTMLLWVGAVPAGTPRNDSARSLPFIHIFTPETDKTTHYWFATAHPRNLGPQYEQRALQDLEFLRGPFMAEDLPMLQMQQEAMGDAEFWDLKPVLLPGDAAAVRARRVLDQMIKEEESIGAAKAA